MEKSLTRARPPSRFRVCWVLEAGLMHKLSARVIDGEADNPVNTIVSGHLPEAALYPLFSGGLSRTRQSLAEIALSRRTLPLTTTSAPPLRRFVGMVYARGAGCFVQAVDRHSSRRPGSGDHIKRQQTALLIRPDARDVCHLAAGAHHLLAIKVDRSTGHA